MPLLLTPRQLNQRASFYHQLGQLTAAGVTVVSGLEMLERHPPSRAYSKPIERMLLGLSRGSTLADVMRAEPDWMPEFDVALVHAAENSGRLDQVFGMLAEYYTERASLVRQMISDLAYPLFVFHLAVFLFPFMRWFSGGISSVRFFVETFGVIVPLYALTTFLVYAANSSRGDLWRERWEKLLRPVPVLGTARQFLALARLSAALEALLNAGVTVIEAWEIAANASGSPALQRAVHGWKPAVVSGQPPSEAVRTSSAFPEMFANLYFAGEVSGQLDDTLKRLRDYYAGEGSRKMRAFGKWVPQMIYMLVAGLVAYKVISFWLGYIHDLSSAGSF